MTAKSRAEQLAEKAKRLAPKTTTPDAPEPAHHVPAAAAPQAKPTRVTLDLPPALARDFNAWLNESAARLGRSRLTKQQVLTELVRRLMRDENLTAKLLADLREDT